MTPREIVVLILCIGGLIYAFWRFFVYRKKLGPFPPRWRYLLRKHVLYYRRLPRPERRRFEESVQRFLAEVKISGVNTKVTLLDRLLVASGAVIPLFGFPGWRYPNLNEVLLYTGAFNEDYLTEGRDTDILGMVGSGGAMNRMMILSQPELRLGFKQKRGRKNVIIHEFIHLFDLSDGAVDGVPEHTLDDHYIRPWLDLMHQEMGRIERGKSDISSYAATNEAEFLSVAGEYFFQRPDRLEEKHPELYRMLSEIFHQDPLRPEQITEPATAEASPTATINTDP